ncbi:MAG: hypothetical protein HY053_08020 [Proteobacteria bacterium]|nr:hypothetical protein [Pseudomonadota bacterium]
MDFSCQSYRSIAKNSAKTSGEFKVAFGEYPRLSSFTMQYGDNISYDFGTTGHMKRGARNGSNDMRSNTTVATDACRLIRNPEYMKEIMKDFDKKKYNISPKDLKAFAENIERRNNVHESDTLTGKLMS